MGRFSIYRKQYEKDVERLYKAGNSAREIRSILNLSVSERAIQRWLAEKGLIRSNVDAFRLAVKQGKVHYWYREHKVKRDPIPVKLRYIVLQRDKFRCVICGTTANDGSGVRIEVDHINNDKTDNRLENLQTLCGTCNKGKSQYDEEINKPKVYQKKQLGDIN